jgi:hypothetical protein
MYSPTMTTQAPMPAMRHSRNLVVNLSSTRHLLPKSDVKLMSAGAMRVLHLRKISSPRALRRTVAASAYDPAALFRPIARSLTANGVPSSDRGA